MPTTIEDLLHEAYSRWDDGPALCRLGQEIHDRNRLDHAKRILERAVELTPDDVEAWAHLGYAHFRSLDDEGGWGALRRGIEATGSEALKMTLARFSEGDEARRLREEVADSRDPRVRAGRLAERFWQGEHDEALAGLRALAAGQPDPRDVQETLIWTLLRARGQGAIEGLDLHDEAVPLADALIEARPDRVAGWSLKLMLLNAEHDWDGILGTTEAALARFPDEETVMQMRARAWREKGEAERAVGWYHRAIGAKPSFAGARVELGRLYEKLGRLDLAEEVFREMPRANPGYPLAPVSLALFLARRERWDEAERLLLDAWPALPDYLRDAVRGNPDAQPLLEREAVREAVSEGAAAS